MPDPNRKISTPSQESPCAEIKLACTGRLGGDDKNKTCEKTIEIEKEATDNNKTQDQTKKTKDTKKRKTSIDTEQAILNKEPCPSGQGVGCQLARPDHSEDPIARIDNKKPGCIDFEACDEDEVQTENNKAEESGCIDFEDCNEYLKEEKRKLKEKKEEEIRKKKELAAKAKADKNKKE